MSRKMVKNVTREKALLGVEPLEPRELMSVSQLWFSDGTRLCVKTDDASTSVELRQYGSNVTVKDLNTSRSWSYAAAKVKAFEFQGGSGNDRFVNHISRMPIRAWGFGGNDYLEGYNGADYLDGGSGNDTLVGYGGNDVLRGREGKDILRGGSGNDRLFGDADNDQLAGGGGVDYLYGGTGNDALVGGDLRARDYLYGQADADRFLRENGDFAMDLQSEDASILFRNGSSAWNENELLAVDNAFAELQAAAGGTRLLKDTLSNRELVFQKESGSFGSAGRNTTTPVYERYWDFWKFTWKERYLWTERLIQIKDFNESNAASRAAAVDTVIHEIGHNWDSSQERAKADIPGSTWDAFARISDWRSSNPGSTHYLSGDGSWYYSKASRAGFFGDIISTGRGNSLFYGKWNPREDFATSFEEWFKILRESGPFGISGGIAGTGRNSYAQAKLDAVSDLIARV
jgi:hypothetical protein